MDKYMEVAYEEALKAYKKNEIPVGAVIVKNHKIIAKAHNNRQYKSNVLGHAEINAILKAEKKIKDWRLNECIMYVTLKPCNMCKTIIDESRINKVYYLLDQDNQKYVDDKITQTNVCNNILDNYEKIIEKFFKKMR